MPRPASDWITLTDAAAIFAAANIQVSRSTLARWAKAGKLQSVRPGRRIYVRKSEVRSLLRPHRTPEGASLLPEGGLFDDLPT
jgi:excisionase family DNA binding protein